MAAKTLHAFPACQGVREWVRQGPQGLAQSKLLGLVALCTALKQMAIAMPFVYKQGEEAIARAKHQQHQQHNEHRGNGPTLIGPLMFPFAKPSKSKEVGVGHEHLGAPPASLLTFPCLGWHKCVPIFPLPYPTSNWRPNRVPHTKHSLALSCANVDPSTGPPAPSYDCLIRTERVIGEGYTDLYRVLTRTVTAVGVSDI